MELKTTGTAALLFGGVQRRRLLAVVLGRLGHDVARAQAPEPVGLLGHRRAFGTHHAAVLFRDAHAPTRRRVHLHHSVWLPSSSMSSSVFGASPSNVGGFVSTWASSNESPTRSSAE